MPCLTVAATLRTLRTPTRLVVLAVGITLIAVASAWTSSAQILGTPELQVARQGHTATLLTDGRVLLIGGENENGPVSQAEIFDPGSGQFAVVANSIVSRADHTATKLADGRVFIISGQHNNASLDSTEVFDPATNSFATGPVLKHPRAGHSATVLADGRIFIVGGDVTGSAEIFDPATQSFTLLTTQLGLPRVFHRAALLQNGQVLLAGGVGPGDNLLNSAEVFDTATQSFFFADNMQVARVTNPARPARRQGAGHRPQHRQLLGNL